MDSRSVSSSTYVGEASVSGVTLYRTPQVFLVFGARGSGKTALVREATFLAEEMREEGAFPVSLATPQWRDKDDSDVISRITEYFSRHDTMPARSGGFFPLIIDVNSASPDSELVLDIHRHFKRVSNVFLSALPIKARSNFIHAWAVEQVIKTQGLTSTHEETALYMKPDVDDLIVSSSPPRSAFEVPYITRALAQMHFRRDAALCHFTDDDLLLHTITAQQYELDTFRRAGFFDATFSPKPYFSLAAELVSGACGTPPGERNTEAMWGALSEVREFRARTRARAPHNFINCSRSEYGWSVSAHPWGFVMPEGSVGLRGETFAR